jgi:hypothetical protein
MNALRETRARSCVIAALAFLLAGLELGCNNGSSGVTETEGKTRLTRLLRLYQVYVDKKKKGPANEQDLRDLAQKLTPQEREDFLIGDDLQGIFISPRDNQPFVIKYNLNLAPGGATQSVAWEAKGQNGKRYVALSVGYVEEYGEEMLKEYVK